jgi:hypothetical protein
MKTLEHHLRLIAGDLVLRVASQAAEIDALREQLALATAPAPSAPVPAPPDGRL